MSETYVIENGIWGIKNDGTKAVNKGLNAAIMDAKNKGYTRVKLTPGTYLVNVGETNISSQPANCIELQSHTTYIFENVTFVIQNNNYPAYVILDIWQKEYVTILGGRLIGDKNGHDYTNNYPIYPTHEFGYGIQVAESHHVTIDSCEIFNMTGDAIFIKGVSNPVVNCMNPIIRNCKLHDNRRQGISLLSALHGVFENNEIYNIKGIAPQFGIDCEPDQNGAVVQFCKFENNKFYNNTGGDIDLYKASYCTIEKNEFSSSTGIAIIYANQNKIVNNIFLNGSSNTTSNTSLSGQNEHIGNVFYGGGAWITDKEHRFINNKIYNGKLYINGTGFYSEANEIRTSVSTSNIGFSMGGNGESHNDKIIGAFQSSIHVNPSGPTSRIILNDVRIENYYFWGNFSGNVVINNIHVDKGTETTSTSIETSFANNSNVVFNGGTILNMYSPLDINAASPTVVFRNVNFLTPNSYIWVRNTAAVVIDKCYFKTNGKKVLDCYAGGSLRLIGSTLENIGPQVAAINTTNLTPKANIYNNVLFGCTMNTKASDVLSNNIVV